MKRRVFSACVIFLIFLVSRSNGASPAYQKIGRIIVHTQFPSPGADTYRSLIPFKEGDTITEDALQQGHSLLMETGMFAKVEITSRGEPEHTEVSVDLSQVERIRRIEIHGNFPVLSSSIHRVLESNEGDAFDAEKIPEEEKRIIGLFEKKGWYGTRVETSYRSDSEDGSVTLAYRVHRGVHLRLAGIELEGVKHGVPAKIEALLSPCLWISGNAIDNKLQRVARYYKSLGYPSVHVSVKSLDVDLKNKRASLCVAIREGKRLVITVSGNTRIGEARILKATTFAGSGGYSYFDMEDSKQAITALYEKGGFPFVKVEGTREEDPEEVAVHFSIKEGNKAFLQRIVIEGNNAISSRLIRKHMLTHKRNLFLFRRGLLQSKELGNDRSSIEDLYLSRGFLDVKVSTDEIQTKKTGRRSTLIIRIDEGPQYVIAASKFQGNAAFSEKELNGSLAIHPGEPFNEGVLAQGARRITQFYTTRGHIKARVETAYHVLPEHKVEMIFTVREGPAYTAGGVFTTGNLHTKTQTICQAVALEPGKPITPDALEKSRKRLRQLGVFDSIFIRPVGLGQPAQEKGGATCQVPVVVSVRERTRLDTEIGARYDSDLGVEGLISLGYENLFGSAKKARLYLLAGQKETEATASFTDPILFGYSLIGSITSGYKREELEAYKKETTTVELSCYKILWDHKLTPSLNLSFEHAVAFDVISVDPSAPKPESTNSIFLEPRVVFDFTDDKFYPTRGWYGIAGVGVSSRKWGSDANLVRYNLQGKSFISIVPGWIIASNLALDDLEPFGSTTQVPSPELLFAGGNSTVRGFPKDSLGPLDTSGNPLGGRTRVLGNIELRFPIYRIINGVFFIDTGSISDGLDKVNLRWSAGGGLRLYTPVGPIRAEYGYQLQKNPPLARGEFLFSLGFPF